MENDISDIDWTEWERDRLDTARAACAGHSEGVRRAFDHLHFGSPDVFQLGRFGNHRELCQAAWYDRLSESFNDETIAKGLSLLAISLGGDRRGVALSMAFRCCELEILSLGELFREMRTEIEVLKLESDSRMGLIKGLTAELMARGGPQ